MVFDWHVIPTGANLMTNTSLRRLSADCLAAGLLISALLVMYASNAQHPLTVAPAIIAYGSVSSGIACLALVWMLAMRKYTRLLLGPMFLAGMSPMFCLTVACLAGNLSGTVLITTALAICLSVMFYAVLRISRGRPQEAKSIAPRQIPNV